ncbi:MAG: hypothetical protein JXB49_09835, partial [Bacteroidales bacterium]|nr:hypothetical protein [Bacteroidales bacterium]
MKSLHQSILSSIAILIIFQVGTLRGQMATQTIVPQSPDAAQLGFFGTASVGMFTGTLQQSIPLFEFKTANLTLPITLNYSSNGLIVDKVASWVGHDWSLEAGGIITVSVKGRQDSKGGGRLRFLSSYSALYIALNRRSYEFQPDEYSFNFNGYSGMFFLNATGDTAFINPYQKMKISTSDANNNMHNGTDFIITTADGIKYIFKAREIKNCLSCENYDVFPTSWYLTSIIHPAGDTINLYYETPWLVNYYAGLSQNISVNISKSCEGSMTCSNSGTEVIGIGEQTYITYLDSIKSTNYGTVIFEKTSNRKDYTGGKRLSKIIVKNSSRQIVKTFEFGHNFYKSHVNYPNGNFSGRYASGYLKDLKYRMFLNDLTIKDSQGGNIQHYNFEYRDTSYLPARLSFSQDHWGYFNGKGNNQYAPKNCVPAAYSAMFPSNLADKSPDYFYSQRGMLSKIIYATGGYSTFEYEAHSTGTSTIGGCRVKKILTYDNASTMPVVKRYFYSNGQTQGTPNYYNTYTRHNLCISNNIPLLGVCYYASLVSNSLTNMYASNGNNIVYQSVTLSHGGDNYENGGETHNFDVRFNNPGTSYNSNGGIILPLPYNNDGWYSGTKSSELIFKINSSGDTVNVRRTSYNYNRTDTRNKINYSCLALINRSDEQPSTYSGKTDGDLLFYFDMVRYQLLSVWQQLTSKTETEYDDSGNELSTVTTYYYDNATHAQLSRESTTNSKGESVLKKYYYPHDYATSLFNIVSLKDSFILN